MDRQNKGTNRGPITPGRLALRLLSEPRRLHALPLVGALLGGALLGLAALTRAALLYFLPVLSVFLLLVHRRERGRALAAAVLVPLAAGLVILPWTIRNTRLHGGLVLIETNGAYNLWRGNGPGAFANRCDPATPQYPWPFDCIPISPLPDRAASLLIENARHELGKRDLGDLEVVRYAEKAAWREIRSDPATFAQRLVPRLVDMWNPTSFLLRHLAVGAYGEVSWLAAFLVSWAAVLCYGAAVGLALAGAWLERRNPATWLIALLVLFYSAITAVSFGLTRFRLPLEPLLLLLAGAALVALGKRRGRRGAAAFAVAALGLVGCGENAPPRSADPRPNLLWIVWDTARADRLSLYGHERPTTPRLAAFAQTARVFEDARAPAGYTLPSHASMFTGLYPSEHCVNNATPHLDDSYTTLAELLRDAGYQTFLYSENPHVSAGAANLAQGFETVEHPWSPARAEAARRIVEAKLPPEERTSELRERLATARNDATLAAWSIKAAGELAEPAVLAWLEAADASRPWLVFVNYMEAHRPTLPPRRYREQVMAAGDIEASYAVDRSWLPTWEYTFGLREYSEREIGLTRATYDAALAELDDLTGALLDELAARGALDDTVVVITSDHGELLGEHHMLDHQYVLHEELLRVPLVVRAPGRFSPGRELRPVATLDLFATLLDLAGVARPAGTHGQGLLEPLASRARLAESPAAASVGIEEVRARHPSFDPTPFQRRLRAWTDLPWKYVWSSDGRHALYDLVRDPGESRNRLLETPAVASGLAAALDSYGARLHACAPGGEPAPRHSPAELERLRALGYATSESAP